MLNVDLPGSGITELILLDLLGKQVLAWKIGSEKTRALDLSELRAGMYLLKVKDADKLIQVLTIIRQ